MTSLGSDFGTLTVVKKFVIALAVTLLASSGAAQIPQNKTTQKRQSAGSDFSFSGALVQSKPIREELAQMTLANLGAKYRLENRKNHSSFLGLSMDYSYTWARYKDETHSQLDSFAAFGSRSTRLKIPGSVFSYGVELGLPANEADSNAGFAGSLSIPLEISFGFSRQLISLALQPTFYQYKYKTSTEEGVEYNKKISGLAALGLHSRFTKNLSWKNSISFFEYENMAGNTYQIYSMSSFFRYQILAAVTVLVGLVSRDRVITTKSVLADDITAFRAGLEWNY